MKEFAESSSTHRNLHVKKKRSADILLNRYSLMMAHQLLKRSESPGYDVWPSPLFHPAEANEFIYVPFLEKLNNLIKKLIRKGYSGDRIASFFISPSRIAHIAYLFPGLPFTRLTRSEAINLCLKLLTYMSYFRNDPFCEDGTNIIWDENKVKETSRLLLKLQLKKMEEAKDVLGKINALLFCYTELIYFCHHAFGHEFHGPYKLARQKQILIREYFDLKPDFWNFTSGLPFEKVTIVAEYPANIKLSIDFTGRIVTSGLLPKSLLRFLVMIDEDKIMNIVDLPKILGSLEKTMKKGIKTILKMDKKQLIMKYAEAYFYILKPLALKANEKWMPPKNLYKNIKENKPPKVLPPEVFANLGKLPEEKRITRLMGIFDPRQSFNRRKQILTE